MGRVFRLFAAFLVAAGLLFAPSGASGQASAQERIFYNAKVFTADPQNPYADAVAIRGDKILAVGNLPEIEKSVSTAAERIDLNGKTLFPGFIDSHSHAIEGGLSLIGADVTDKIDTLDQLRPFVDDARKAGRGMRGDILEVEGMPLAFWSHPDVLNSQFSSGAYESQPVLLNGMDGHTAWANRVLLQRAGITREFLAKLTPAERAYYGVDKDSQPTGFLVDAGKEKVEALLPKWTDEQL